MLKWTRRMRISIYQPVKLKPHGSVCPPFWILTVEWSGAWSHLFWWRHCFQIASFSPSTLENSVFKKHCFKIAPLWRAFLNGSVFGDRFWRCSVDDSRIWSKTAPFLFENGLVWTRPNRMVHCQMVWKSHHRNFFHDAFSGSKLFAYGKRIFGSQKIHLTRGVSNLPLPVLTLEITH